MDCSYNIIMCLFFKEQTIFRHINKVMNSLCIQSTASGQCKHGFFNQSTCNKINCHAYTTYSTHRGFPKHTKSCSHFPEFFLLTSADLKSLVSQSSGTSSQSEGYRSKWLFRLVCREPMLSHAYTSKHTRKTRTLVHTLTRSCATCYRCLANSVPLFSLTLSLWTLKFPRLYWLPLADRRGPSPRTPHPKRAWPGS